MTLGKFVSHLDEKVNANRHSNWLLCLTVQANKFIISAYYVAAHKSINVLSEGILGWGS